MKKSAKAKAPKAAKAPKKEKPDLVELVTKVKEQMAILEMKVDILIERLTIKPPEVKFQPEPPLPRGEFQRPQETRPPAANGGRVMHKAICADCNKECEVPFQPREGRAVYCKECFAKRRSGGSARVSGNSIHAEVKPAPAPARPGHKQWGNVKRKSADKKAVGKGRKR